MSRVGQLGVVVAVVAVVVLAAAARTRADGAMMTVDPPSQNLAPDASEVTVDVKLTGGSNIGAWEFGLKYNTDVLAFVKVTEGPFLKSAGLGTLCSLSDQQGLGPDVIQYGCGIVAPNAAFVGPDGDGVLATLTFHPKGTGLSNLVFVKRELSGPLGAGDSRAVDSSDGAIQVADPGQQVAVPPTPTPNPVALTPVSLPARQPDDLVRNPSTATGSVPPSGQGQASSPSSGAGSTAVTGDVESATAGGQRSGSGTAASGSGSSGGFPKSGTGPEQHDARYPWQTSVFIAVAGLALAVAGAVLRRLRV